MIRQVTAPSVIRTTAFERYEALVEFSVQPNLRTNWAAPIDSTCLAKLRMNLFAAAKMALRRAAVVTRASFKGGSATSPVRKVTNRKMIARFSNSNSRKPP